MNQTCKVCGEPAAGFHFGAFTCEGCKVSSFQNTNYKLYLTKIKKKIKNNNNHKSVSVRGTKCRAIWISLTFNNYYNIIIIIINESALKNLVNLFFFFSLLYTSVSVRKR